MWRPDALGHYPAEAYRVGFAVLVLLQLPGLVIYALRRLRPQHAMSKAIIPA
jgi:hypothetical protein